jgi:amino acid adenylation domain-containing protein
MPVITGFADRTLPYGEILSSDEDGNPFLQINIDVQSLACVIFTSGSTGVPKGAMLDHSNLVNYLRNMVEAYGFDTGGRTLQKTLLSFDASLVEWLLPMFTGGSVVVPSADGIEDMGHLVSMASRHGVSYVFFAPAQLKLFLDVAGIEVLRGALRTVACGGEVLPGPLVSRCAEVLDAALYNIYGPTETAISVAQWRCPQGHGHNHVPIGRPNANVDIRIMDTMGRPVPPGMSGELWIGGAQTGRGYINIEEETHKRFVVDPIEPGSGRRYYRTGDVARFLPDGNLLFLGRMDDQVKVRGVRVELGDVMAALLRCEGVSEAVPYPCDR